MNRREFLKQSSLVAGAVLAQQLVDLDRLAGAAPAEKRGEMLYRPLGSTGEKLSVLGLGGAHIGRQPDEKESIALVKGAIDRGITFLDNSWDYNGGESEKRMGKALEGGYRDKVFLMTKFDGRTRNAALKQIDESLKRLKTDHVDLLMFHEVIRMNDPDRFFGPDGAVQAALEAQKAGKTRYLGFTGHKDPAIHLHMLDLARAHNFKPDAVLMPLNVMDAHFRSFQHQVLPRLISERIGVLSMKPLGDAIILQSKAVSAIECLHYAMTVNPGSVVTGIDSLAILDRAIEAVRCFTPLTREQQVALLARTERFARSGEYELFKTTGHFDSTAKHPEWMG
ncbi:oxidoreductase [Geomonas limicola]|uniref:Oxidoreductase n=1 Tax=Geomonas limicola TaxID=2740186 RepID=A0A6V8N5F8_9BACT|nr:aldo/keto reductase [Geomonas limicola]GFO67174.1 oxidoreductase [Geomonas limicola]